MIKGLILAVFVGFVGVSAQAKIEIPNDKDVMYHFGACKSEFLPSNFQLFIWNIKKAEAKAEWARDFEYFTPKSDVVLLQEAMMDNFVPAIALGQKGFCWDFATSFIDNDRNPTGVMTGSPIIPLSIHFLRSPGREPVLKTPKMVIVAEYALANSPETLWVANIHGLNFVSNKLNREQIEQVAAFLKKHNGPVIFAGDFNSWNNERLQNLDEILGKLAMKKLSFANDDRKLKLDHIYVRGLEATRTDLHRNINSSDHKPLTAEFRLK
ncbi:endonuclease/exonuclease/phosphatase family protein [uncultured Bdellovibrio sp.]|uniref:endonuclease/exonuclease/phosphatase family protein n=1 Tax=Bdellovibrio sp. HCB-162 TaxID=3394234 RepID=UPI0025DC490A|nr:endonuclease/exonuclease/phosphatase family protein [uncultured Bdellovibrio sp.]